MREIGLHSLGRELLLDLLIEPVAQAAGERDGDAGKALLEILDPAVMRAGRTGAVEHQGLFELGLLVQRVDAFGTRERLQQDERCRRAAPASAAASIRRAWSFPRSDKLAYHTLLELMPGWLDAKSGRNREERPMQRHAVDRRLFLGASAVTLLGAAGAARAQAPQAAKARRQRRRTTPAPSRRRASSTSSPVSISSRRPRSRSSAPAPRSSTPSA